MAYCNLDKRIYDGIGRYGIPEILPYHGGLPEKWLGFNYTKQLRFCGKEIGTHFCLDDHNFETVWNHPNKYIENFKRCGVMVSPDFSIYSDFPLVIQVYNHYRKHWLARFYQERGVNVISTVGWADEGSYEWCFDGEPKNSIVAVGTSGCFDDKVAERLFHKGYDEMLKRLTPEKIICFTLLKNPERLKLQGDIQFIDVRRFKK